MTVYDRAYDVCCDVAARSIGSGKDDADLRWKRCIAKELICNDDPSISERQYIRDFDQEFCH